MFETPFLATPCSWSLLVSTSSSQPTLFAQPPFHEEAHHYHDQPTSFSSTLQYAGPQVSHGASGERTLPLHRRPFPVGLLHLISSLSNSYCDILSANEARRLRERSRIFDIPGLFAIVARTLKCELGEIVDLRKLGEGGLNRTFLVTLQDDFKLVARIPYPILTPKAYAYASEVATMDFLRSKGLPIPKVYGYSFTSENKARTEYILMEYVEGTDLGAVWFDLEKNEIDSFMDQLAKFESTMMSISFPAGGSIYYARDLKQLSGSEGILLEGENQDIPLDEQIGSISLEEEKEGISPDEQAERILLQKERFCVGPDVSIPLWYGRREKMGTFRGPCTSHFSHIFCLFLINCGPRQRRRIGAGHGS